MSLILAIESSCDDTSAAVLRESEILSNVVYNQAAHKIYGGVVPELASREHIQKIVQVIDHALKEAKVSKNDLNAIAVTRGPGLLGSLIVGVGFAKSLSQSLEIPLIEVQHTQAHVLSNLSNEQPPSFPFLCLTVSGGHTQIVKVESPSKLEILGKTIDDAAGEAFDKAGKMLNLPYPAGPEIDKLAKLGTPKYSFSKSKVGDYDYSFSGFKTSVLYFLRDQLKENENFIEENLNDLCASIQSNICEVLMQKYEKAAINEGITNLCLAGGVSANSGLRQLFQETCEKNGWKSHIPDFKLCTDNAGMIGIAAYYKYLNNDFSDLDLTPDARMQF